MKVVQKVVGEGVASELPFDNCYLFIFFAKYNLIIVVYDNCHIYIFHIYFMHICLQMLSPYSATCCSLDFLLYNQHNVNI